MEVHHKPDLHHKPKPWKEYLLEGLMIFIAVTMGFFAENYREHLGDDAKERQYMVSMINDLRKDVSNIDELNRANDSVTKDCNVLIELLSDNLNNHQTIVNAYAIFERSTLTFYDLTFSDVTLSQLKYNGGFRIIRNEKVIEMILSYDVSRTLLSSFKDDLSHYNNLVYDNEGRRVFNTRFLRALLDSLNRAPETMYCFYPLQKLKAAIAEYGSIKLMTTDKSTIGFLCNDLRTYISHVTNYAGLTKLQKQKAIALIKLIKTEYDLHGQSH